MIRRFAPRAPGANLRRLPLGLKLIVLSAVRRQVGGEAEGSSEAYGELA